MVYSIVQLSLNFLPLCLHQTARCVASLINYLQHCLFWEECLSLSLWNQIYFSVIGLLVLSLILMNISFCQYFFLLLTCCASFWDRILQ
jgi:hypothetical protein